MAGRTLAGTRPAAFQSEPAEICGGISRLIPRRHPRVSCPTRRIQRVVVTSRAGDDSAIGCRNSERLQSCADLPILQPNSSWAANHTVSALVLLLICLCSAPVAAASPRSLCSSEENVLFTCSIGTKLVSVCSSPHLSRTSGYVQYRYGTRNRVPELVYPAEKIHPASKFSVGYTGSAKSSLENLHFTLSGHSYTIYRESAAFGENGSGIKVKTPAGKSSRLPCKELSPPSDLYGLAGLRLRKLPAEALVSLRSFETRPAESPSTDLLQGVRSHDFVLVAWALDNGADVNFQGPYDVGVLGALVDGRSEAIRLKRVVDFDDETDRLLALLLSRGALPTISTPNGGTPIDFLAKRGPNRTVRALLDVGWPTDYHYRLYVGALLGDPDLVKEALDRGADPNKPIRGSRLIVPAIARASELSYKGGEAEHGKAVAALEQLLKAGATIDEGIPTSGGGDIVTVYAHSGHKENISRVLDLLVRYATPTARKNSLSWLRIQPAQHHPQRQANLDWLIKRLDQ